MLDEDDVLKSSRMSSYRRETMEDECLLSRRRIMMPLTGCGFDDDNELDV